MYFEKEDIGLGEAYPGYIVYLKVTHSPEKIENL